MEGYNGGWSVKQEWEREGFWTKLDALSIIFIRLEWVVLIISIIITIISAVMLKMATDIAKETKEAAESSSQVKYD